MAGPGPGFPKVTMESQGNGNPITVITIIMKDCQLQPHRVHCSVMKDMLLKQRESWRPVIKAALYAQINVLIDQV